MNFTLNLNNESGSELNVEPSIVNVAATFPFSSVTSTTSVFLSLISFVNTSFET